MQFARDLEAPLAENAVLCAAEIYAELRFEASI